MNQQGYQMKLLPTKTQKFENDVLLEADKFKPLMDPSLFDKIFQVSLSLNVLNEQLMDSSMFVKDSSLFNNERETD